jgi:hypothetical protein
MSSANHKLSGWHLVGLKFYVASGQRPAASDQDAGERMLTFPTTLSDKMLRRQAPTYDPTAYGTPAITDVTGRDSHTPQQPGYKIYLADNTFKTARTLTSGVILTIATLAFQAIISNTAKSKIGSDVIGTYLWVRGLQYYINKSKQRDAVDNFLVTSCLRVSATQAHKLGRACDGCSIWAILDQLRMPTALAASQGIADAGTPDEVSYTPEELVRAYNTLGDMADRNIYTRLAIRMLQFHRTEPELMTTQQRNQIARANLDVANFTYLKHIILDKAVILELCHKIKDQYHANPNLPSTISASINTTTSTKMHSISAVLNSTAQSIIMDPLARTFPASAPVDSLAALASAASATSTPVKNSAAAHLHQKISPDGANAMLTKARESGTGLDANCPLLNLAPASPSALAAAVPSAHTMQGSNSQPQAAFLQSQMYGRLTTGGPPTMLDTACRVKECESYIKGHKRGNTALDRAFRSTGVGKEAATKAIAAITKRQCMPSNVPLSTPALASAPALVPAPAPALQVACTPPALPAPGLPVGQHVKMPLSKFGYKGGGNTYGITGSAFLHIDPVTQVSTRLQRVSWDDGTYTDSGPAHLIPIGMSEFDAQKRGSPLPIFSDDEVEDELDDIDFKDGTKNNALDTFVVGLNDIFSA